MAEGCGASITGLILAGGRSSRMGGVDKAGVMLKGKPMILWVAERLRPQVECLQINSNSATVSALLPDVPVIVDRIAGFAGPLAGLHAGLACATTPFLVCVPCDAPLLPTNLVARLYAGLLAANADVAVVRSQSGLQPTFLLCRCSVKKSIEDFLAGGHAALHKWVRRERHVEVDFDNEADFSNVNSPEDLPQIALRVRS